MATSRGSYVVDLYSAAGRMTGALNEDGWPRLSSEAYLASPRKVTTTPSVANSFVIHLMYIFGDLQLPSVSYIFYHTSSPDCHVLNRGPVQSNHTANRCFPMLVQLQKDIQRLDGGASAYIYAVTNEIVLKVPVIYY